MTGNGYSTLARTSAVVLDLALDFAQQAAFIQLGIRAAPSRDCQIT